MKLCAIKGCKRKANGTVTFKCHEVCLFHEERHWNDPKAEYIWKKLGIKDYVQLRLA